MWIAKKVLNTLMRVERNSIPFRIDCSKMYLSFIFAYYVIIVFTSNPKNNQSHFKKQNSST
jgi:hypothetical protein